MTQHENDGLELCRKKSDWSEFTPFPVDLMEPLPSHFDQENSRFSYVLRERHHFASHKKS
jgi:hypothetical protein